MIASPSHLTADEYLAFERASSVKHEYRSGQVYAMAGASNNHVIIAGNLFAMLRVGLRGQGCRPYISDTKVHIAAKNTYYYPDIVVSCDSRESGLQDFLAFPCLIVEVLSDTTEAFDRGSKFADYRALGSLKEYVLVDQKSISVEVFCRNSLGQWVLSAYEAGDRVSLSSVDVSFDVAELYEDVEFESAN
ncbi:Uma2 family endonuclease [Leptolyngbya cf. ectocarpi LEGE 11479]|uniref:Uma2 family endonuclease n=1 Tax=Leptolyngbya cf. ectocarpi LEGE 11479 TaxID=1828722 RepID=A0A929FD56_LEPEC|nr:Uma2 family endonuclease [Leptolyngbya ectocarpi]MBE9070704.1 Uma2 family endonuclease [Leptolyngbya cf. ectocarpi LEGE 11479]